MDILIYSFAIFIVGVIVLAFYTTVQSFKMKSLLRLSGEGDKEQAFEVAIMLC